MRRPQRLGRRPVPRRRRRPGASDVALRRSLGPTSTWCATGFARFDLLDDRVRFLQGRLADTLPDAPIERLALLRIGAGVGDDVAAESSTPSTTGWRVGGVRDRRRLRRRRSGRCAVDEFRAGAASTTPIERVGWYGRRLAQDAPTRPTRARRAPSRPVERRPTPPVAPIARRPPTRRPLASSSSSTTCGARRRARCTRCHAPTSRRRRPRLRGDRRRERLGRRPEARRGVRRGASAPSSATSTSATRRRRRRPTRSTGASRSPRGEAIALMIDGAHVLTPGVLRYGMLGLRTYEPAIVATQQWYVGPGQQPDAMHAGYDQRLRGPAVRARSSGRSTATGCSRSATSSATATGSTGCGRATASSCPARCSSRSAASTRASRCRAAATPTSTSTSGSARRPDVTVVTILGEGSFHQVHGGTTTNQARPRRARPSVLSSYREHFARARGRGLRGPRKPIHYVGSMPGAARRTRRAPHDAPSFVKQAQVARRDGRPESPCRSPTSSRPSSSTPSGTAWRGGRRPGSVAASARPDRPLRVPGAARHRCSPTGSSRPAPAPAAAPCSSRRSASCLGHGQVVSIDQREADGPSAHPRLRYLIGHPVDDGTRRSR